MASYGTLQDKATIDEIGRALAKRWEKKNNPDWNPRSKKFSPDNPYSLAAIAKIKNDFDKDPDKTREKHKDIFYYFDGLLGSKISQSVHPAGMVISPISLSQHYGTFLKDGEWCLLLDMDEVHDGCGLAKYDFLLLKTIKVIRDACSLAGIPYPKSHEINWCDEAVWEDMRKNQTSIFQFESGFAAESFKKFKTDSIEDMSLVTACIRPSGTSYRDALLGRQIHHNPSALIDNLLKNNNGYLVYQEDIIAFLQQVCGLSGSYADTVRRGIARKKPEILAEALPKILDGYCSKSDKPREVAEKECEEFLKIIEDASAYMFGLNHSIAYCLLGYLCGYLRYYHPGEYITSFLNNAANDDDLANGAMLARLYGLKITMPKYGISDSNYAYDPETQTIAKGLSSIKGLGDKDAGELLDVARQVRRGRFSDVVHAIKTHTHVNSGKLDTLIHIDFFSMFGNQRELENIVSIYDMFADRKQLNRDEVDGSRFGEIIRAHSTDRTKNGKQAARYTITDNTAIIRDCEDRIMSLHLPDFSLIAKVKFFAEVMGYFGYATGRDEDMKKLYIKEVYPLKRKSDGKQFGYSVITQSIGSGKESRFTVFNREYNYLPITKGDIIHLIDWSRDKGQYFTLRQYTILNEGDMSEIKELA